MCRGRCIATVTDTSTKRDRYCKRAAGSAAERAGAASADLAFLPFCSSHASIARNPTTYQGMIENYRRVLRNTLKMDQAAKGSVRVWEHGCRSASAGSVKALQCLPLRIRNPDAVFHNEEGYEYARLYRLHYQH